LSIDHEQFLPDEARKLLNSAEAKAGAKAEILFGDVGQQHSCTKRAAASMGIKTRPEDGNPWIQLPKRPRWDSLCTLAKVSARKT